jgi:predicted ferric reductase
MNLWILLRAAGIGAYVMLFLSVVWGLASTTSIFGKRISKASATTVHQFMSTCGLALIFLHVGVLLADSYMPFSVADVAIPMSSTYRPVAISFGVVAMYLTVFVIVTSWMRKTIGTKWWRRTHLLAVPIFVLSLVHGVFAGTDSVRPAMWWTYLGTGLIVLFLLIVRGLTAGYRPERAAPPAHAARAGRSTAPAAAGSGGAGRATPPTSTAARSHAASRPAPAMPELPAPPATA